MEGRGGEGRGGRGGGIIYMYGIIYPMQYKKVGMIEKCHPKLIF